MKRKATHNFTKNFRLFYSALFLLLISISWVHAAEQAKPALNVDSDFITVYPNQFTDREKPFVEKFNAENKAIDDRGQIDVKALVSGKLPKNTPGVGTVLKVTKEMMVYDAKKYDPENPLLSDSEYAKKLGYKDIYAYPTFAPCDDVIMPKFPGDARDKMLVGDLNHNVTYYKPIYPGDTLYTVINKRYFVDATPKEGSTYRNICIFSEASIYNQNGEKVNEGIFRVMENCRQLKPGKTAINDGGPFPAWESPAWKSRPAHKYTDEDWARIKKMWSEEKRQGATTLYWEDVKEGDYTTRTVDGPIIASVSPTEPFGMGVGGSRTLKKEIMDPAIFKTMHKDANGIWLTEDKNVYIPPVPAIKDDKAAAPAPAPAAAPAADKGSQEKTADIHKAGTGSDPRAVVFNFVGRDMAIRNINNWMGDKGWLYNVRWSIMAPSAMKAVGKTIPASPLSEHYVHRVPILAKANKVVNAHPLTGDLCITQAYIEKKYEKDGKHFVDLVWWDETIDGNIFEEGGATVILPSKNDK